jgi:hypothetical protein
MYLRNLHQRGLVAFIKCSLIGCRQHWDNNVLNYIKLHSVWESLMAGEKNVIWNFLPREKVKLLLLPE